MSKINLDAVNLSSLTAGEQIGVAIAKTLSTRNVKDTAIGQTLMISGGTQGGADMVNTFTRSRAIGEEIRKKAAVSPTTQASSNLVYPSQQSGVTVLVPVVTRSLVAMFAALGSPSLPPNVRALTQAAMLAASEVDEEGMYPAAAPGTEFVLNGSRKFGLILAFNNELLALGSDEVIEFVQVNLENAANNAVDGAVIEAFTTAAGTAQTTVKAAYAAFAGDLRTSVWVGNPETLGGLRSAQEQNIGPNGGYYNGLQALPVLAAPNGTLFLADVRRTAVFDGPQIIEKSDQADVVLDSAPSQQVGGTFNGTLATSMFQNMMTAFKITKYADCKLFVNPVALTV